MKKEQLTAYVSAYFPSLVEIYRCLHQIPELSTQEKDTAAFICNELAECGIEFQSGIGGYGIVAVIYGKEPYKRCIAFRAEMDALPIEEETGVHFSSTYENRMHACGHDMNMTIGLGLAFVLQSLREEWEGCVKIIFQPSEEDYQGGANDLIAKGALEASPSDVFSMVCPKPSLIVGVHASPELALGFIGSREGAFMASTDEIYLEVIGKGGHAAQKGTTINPLVVASEILLSLEEAFKNSPQVLAFGHIQGLGATNVIPNHVKLQGTYRTFDENAREQGYQEIQEIIDQITQKYGATYELDVRKGYPCLYNAPQETQTILRFAKEYLGGEQVQILPQRMTADDFAYYAQQIPGVYLRIGSTSPLKEGVLPEIRLHTSTFQIDERAIEIGVGTLAYAFISILSEA